MVPESRNRSERKVANLTAMFAVLENVRASMSHIPTDLHGLLQG
jgi:hypothetical protein